MSVLTPQHIRPDLSVRLRPSCLSIPPHLPSAFHGSSVKQCVGQALKACSSQLPHVRQHEQQQQQHRPAVHTQALHGHTGCMPSPAHLGWHGNFTSKFTLGPVLGRGSFGTVHEAVRNSTGASYAVKVLHKTGRPAGPAHLEAIKREVCSWAQAQGSKFVAKLEGLYEDEDHAYIVSELCAGGDLKSLLEVNGSFGELDTAVIMRGVLDVLAECHSRNICYGDVKPANFLLSTADGEPTSPRAAGVPALRVRAVDFGCSRAVAKGAPLTQQCGTPLYMAPEMAMQRFGLGVDVWAAGVMMYQMLTGKLPFWANKSVQDISKLMPWEVMAAVRTHEVYYCRQQWAQLTPEARELIGRMLEPNPADRISAEEALAHPWFQRLLGYTPRPSGVLATGNHVVEFQRQQVAEEQPVAAAAAAAEPWRAPAPVALPGRSTSAVLDELLATLSPGRKAPMARMSLSVAA